MADESRLPVVDRRTILRTASGWIVVVGGLGAGCGRTPLFGDGNPANTPTPTPSGSPTPSATPTPVCGCTPVSGADTGLLTTDLPANSVAYKAGGSIFICNDGTGYYAMSAFCTHSNCDMGTSNGVWSGTNLAGGFHCNCHGSSFNADGSVKNGPAQQPLLHYRLSIDTTNQHIYVDLTPPFADISCRCPG